MECKNISLQILRIMGAVDFSAFFSKIYQILKIFQIFETFFLFFQNFSNKGVMGGIGAHLWGIIVTSLLNKYFQRNS